MDEYYKLAIDFLTKDQDWRQTCITLAKENPEVFCTVLDLETIATKVQQAYTELGFVAAIKFHRSETASSLKEAKEYVENLVGHNPKF